MHAAGHPDGAKRAFGPLPALRASQPGIRERELHVDERAGACDEVEALEDEADLAVAQVGEIVLVHFADIDAVDQIAPAGRDVQAAEDVHQRALAAAGAAHDRDEVARVDQERDVAQRLHTDLPELEDLAHAVHLDHRVAGCVLALSGAWELECGPRDELARCAGSAPAASVACARTRPSATAPEEDRTTAATAEAAAPPRPPSPLVRRAPVDVSCVEVLATLGSRIVSPALRPLRMIVEAVAGEPGDDPRCGRPDRRAPRSPCRRSLHWSGHSRLRPA